MDLASLTYDTAKALEGTVFRVELRDGTNVALTLEEVTKPEAPQRRRTRTAATPRREPFPGGREQHLARRTLEELDTECLFESRNRARERRLAHPDRRRGVPEVEVLRDRREGSELGQTGLLHAPDGNH